MVRNRREQRTWGWRMALTWVATCAAAAQSACVREATNPGTHDRGTPSHGIDEVVSMVPDRLIETPTGEAADAVVMWKQHILVGSRGHGGGHLSIVDTNGTVLRRAPIRANRVVFRTEDSCLVYRSDSELRGWAVVGVPSLLTERSVVDREWTRPFISRISAPTARWWIVDELGLSGVMSALVLDDETLRPKGTIPIPLSQVRGLSSEAHDGVVYIWGRAANGSTAVVGLADTDGRLVFERSDVPSTGAGPMTMTNKAVWIGLDDHSGVARVPLDGNDPVEVIRPDATGSKLLLTADEDRRELAAVFIGSRGGEYDVAVVRIRDEPAPARLSRKSHLRLEDWPRAVGYSASDAILVIGSTFGTSQIVRINRD